MFCYIFKIQKSISLSLPGYHGWEIVPCPYVLLRFSPNTFYSSIHFLKETENASVNSELWISNELTIIILLESSIRFYFLSPSMIFLTFLRDFWEISFSAQDRLLEYFAPFFHLCFSEVTVFFPRYELSIYLFKRGVPVHQLFLGYKHLYIFLLSERLMLK